MHASRETEGEFVGGILAIMCNHRKGKPRRRINLAEPEDCRISNIEQKHTSRQLEKALFNELPVIVWSLGLRTCLLERLSNLDRLRIDHRLNIFPAFSAL
jgi:hypothetical protein